MSYAKKLEIYKERSELAPDEFIAQIARFELLVFHMREAQKEFFSSKDKGKKKTYLHKSEAYQHEVDKILDQMGYNPKQHIF